MKQRAKEVNEIGDQLFFATLTKRRLKRGVFRSVADLRAAINRFLEEYNQHSKPSLGPPIQTKSSPLSNEGTKC